MFLIQARQNLGTLWPLLMSRKGLTIGKQRDYSRGVPQPPTGIINKSNTNLKDGVEEVKRHKGALGDSGLRRVSGGDSSPVNVLDTLLVPVQNTNHGAAGPDYDPQKQDWKE